MRTYPLNLVGLEDRRCVVVGGGTVAARKAAGLVAAGARPVVISPALGDDLMDMQTAGQVEHIPRGYLPGDLEGAFLVIAATGDPALNRQIWERGSGEGALVNVVDAPERCHFFAPAIVRRGDLVVGISTGGTAPALAARIRAELEERFGNEYETMTAWCAAIRPGMQDVFPNPEERIEYWYALIDSPVLAHLTAGRIRQARAWVAENLGERLAELVPPEPQDSSDEQRYPI